MIKYLCVITWYQTVTKNVIFVMSFVCFGETPYRIWTNQNRVFSSLRQAQRQGLDCGRALWLHKLIPFAVLWRFQTGMISLKQRWLISCCGGRRLAHLVWWLVDLLNIFRKHFQCRDSLLSALVFMTSGTSGYIAQVKQTWNAVHLSCFWLDRSRRVQP